MALQEDITPKISDWNPEQVAQFVTKIGFPECAKIAIYHKITGAQIANFEETIWNDTFGIVGINEM